MHRAAHRLALRIVVVLALAGAGSAAAADPAKILRVASNDIETLDPHQYNDSPSFDVLVAIFEGLYEWDYLASPARLAPRGRRGAAGDRRRRKALDDPHEARHLLHRRSGLPRQAARAAVADDYVYSLKRWLDPNLRRGGNPIVTDLVVGARAVVDAARASGAKFDYDRPDRRSARDRPLHAATPAHPAELPEHRGVPDQPRRRARGGGGRGRRHPHARGRNRPLPAEGMEARLADRARGEPRLRAGALSGKRRPGARRAHAQHARQGAAADRRHRDQRDRGGRHAPARIRPRPSRLRRAARRDREPAARRRQAEARIRGAWDRAPRLSRAVTCSPIYLNVADPVVGGMGNDRVALRRAIALAIDVETLVRVVYAGQAMPANQIVPPRVTGHDPALPARRPHDRAAANALLDRFGYDKRDPDGYRRGPDGKPLTLTLSLRSAAISREIQTLWKKDMDAIGLRMEYRMTPFQDLIKDLDAGKFQVYFGGYGGIPSGYGVLTQLSGKEPPSVNASRFRSAEYDRAMEEFLRSPTPAGQIGAARRMSEIAQTYVPTIPAIFRLESDFRAAVGAGLRAARVQDVLEIPGHRSRATPADG